MGLATFSAILDFAIRSEEAGLAFFAARADGAPPGLAAPLGRLREEAERNVKAFRTILRENVTEMVMEPFEPIDESRFAPAPPGDDLLAACAGVVGRQRDFLRAAAAAVNLREVKRAFEKIAEKKDRLIGETCG